MHKKSFGGCHHGIHLCVSDKPRNHKFLISFSRSMSDYHDISHRQVIERPIADRHINLARQDIRYFIFHVQQIIKRLSLYGQPVILSAVRKTSSSKHDPAVVQIQEGADLPRLNCLTVLRKTKNSFFILPGNLAAGMHLHIIRNLGSLHQIIHGSCQS